MLFSDQNKWEIISAPFDLKQLRSRIRIHTKESEEVAKLENVMNIERNISKIDL